MQARPFRVTFLLVVLTIFGGLVVRFAPIGLPASIAKYGGSMLWALMIYWLVSALVAPSHPFRAAWVAGGLSAAVEFFKLYRSPAMDAFRLTLPGILLLGRVFSLWDILAYWLAIATGAVIDQKFLRPRRL